MNTREIEGKYRLAQWSNIIQDRNGSGLSIRAYCKEAAISEKTYYYWLKRLREATSEGITQLQCKTKSLVPAGFTEVRLAAPPDSKPVGETQQNQVCIESAGVRISAGSGYPVGNLAKLMREVARSC